MEDIKYIFNNKVYNISTSEKLYEYTDYEETGLMFMGRLPMRRDVKITIYKSTKGRFYKSIVKSGRISITDILENDLKNILIQRNEIEILQELYPATLNQLEEV